VAVALVGAGLGALVGASANGLGGFGFDQGLEHQLHASADDVEVAAGAHGVEQLGQGRFSEGHRRGSFV